MEMAMAMDGQEVAQVGPKGMATGEAREGSVVLAMAMDRRAVVCRVATMEPTEREMVEMAMAMDGQEVAWWVAEMEREMVAMAT